MKRFVERAQLIQLGVEVDTSRSSAQRARAHVYLKHERLSPMAVKILAESLAKGSAGEGVHVGYHHKTERPDAMAIEFFRARTKK